MHKSILMMKRKLSRVLSRSREQNHVEHPVDEQLEGATAWEVAVYQMYEPGQQTVLSK